MLNDQWRMILSVKIIVWSKTIAAVEYLTKIMTSGSRDAISANATRDFWPPKKKMKNTDVKLLYLTLPMLTYYLQGLWD